MVVKIDDRVLMRRCSRNYARFASETILQAPPRATTPNPTKTGASAFAFRGNFPFVIVFRVLQPARGKACAF